MTTYTTPFGVTSQYAFCGLPLRLDSYRGCSFRCLYCFARNRGGARSNDEVVVPADPNYVARVLTQALNESRSPNGLIASFLRQRVPIHFGGMSDPFQPAERSFNVTKRILEAVRQYDYPLVISTRSALVAEKSYLAILKELSSVVVQFSFSSTADEIAKLVGPGCVPPSDLLRTVRASRGA